MQPTPHKRIPIRLSHYASKGVSKELLQSAALEQIQPYLLQSDMITRMALEQLITNQVYSQNSLDFDIVRKGHQWQIDKADVVKGKYTFSDSTYHTTSAQAMKTSLLAEFVCTHKANAERVDLYFDCTLYRTLVERTTIRKGEKESSVTE